MRKIDFKEFENNIDHYIELSNKEDIYVMKDGVETVLTNSDNYRLTLIDQIKESSKCVDEDIDYDEILLEEIMKRSS